MVFLEKYERCEYQFQKKQDIRLAEPRRNRGVLTFLPLVKYFCTFKKLECVHTLKFQLWSCRIFLSHNYFTVVTTKKIQPTRSYWRSYLIVLVVFTRLELLRTSIQVLCFLHLATRETVHWPGKSGLEKRQTESDWITCGNGFLTSLYVDRYRVAEHNVRSDLLKLTTNRVSQLSHTNREIKIRSVKKQVHSWKIWNSQRIKRKSFW